MIRSLRLFLFAALTLFFAAFLLAQQPGQFNPIQLAIRGYGQPVNRWNSSPPDTGMILVSLPDLTKGNYPRVYWEYKNLVPGFGGGGNGLFSSLNQGSTFGVDTALLGSGGLYLKGNVPFKMDSLSSFRTVSVNDDYSSFITSLPFLFNASITTKTGFSQGLNINGINGLSDLVNGDGLGNSALFRANGVSLVNMAVSTSGGGETGFTANTSGVLVRTAGVDAGTAVNGQVLKLVDASNGECEFEENIPTIDFGNIWFVSNTGNNSTAEKGNPAKPLLNLYAARDSAVAGDLIYVQPGYYLIGTGGETPANYNFAKDSVSVYFSPNAKIEYTPSVPFVDVGDNESFLITGYLDIEALAAYFLFTIKGDSCVFRGEFNSMYVRGYTFDLANCKDVYVKCNTFESTKRAMIRVARLNDANVSFDVKNAKVFIDTYFNWGFFQINPSPQNWGGNNLTDSTYFSNSKVAVNVENLTGQTGIFTLYMNGNAFFDNCQFSINAKNVETTVAAFTRGIEHQGLFYFERTTTGIYPELNAKNNTSFILNADNVVTDGFAMSTDIDGVPIDSTWFTLDNSSVGFNVKNFHTTKGLLYTRSLSAYGYGSVFLNGKFTANGTNGRVSEGSNIKLTGDFNIAPEGIEVRDSSSVTFDRCTVSATGDFIKSTSVGDVVSAYSTLPFYDSVTDFLNPIWNTETITATAGQTEFTVTPAKLPTSSANLRVYNDLGARLRETDQYTYVPATGVVTLITPALVGEKYTFEYFQ